MHFKIGCADSEFDTKVDVKMYPFFVTFSNGVGTSALALAPGCDLHSDPVWVGSGGLP